MQAVTHAQDCTLIRVHKAKCLGLEHENHVQYVVQNVFEANQLNLGLFACRDVLGHADKRHDLSGGIAHGRNAHVCPEGAAFFANELFFHLEMIALPCQQGFDACLAGFNRVRVRDIVKVHPQQRFL